MAAADYDNDGNTDLFVAGGGVVDPKGDFAERAPRTSTVYVSLKNGKFVDASAGAGADFASRKAVHRGAAFGDLDDDGRIDVVVSALEAPLEIWRNVSPAPNNWRMVRAVGSTGNRDGIGAKIRVRTASATLYAHVNPAVGFGSASDVRVHFGLGREAQVVGLRVQWPGGAEQVVSSIRANQILTAKESDASLPLARQVVWGATVPEDP